MLQRGKFKTSSRPTLERLGETCTESEVQDRNHDSDSDVDQPPPSLSLQQQLQLALEKVSKGAAPVTPEGLGQSQLSKAVRKELDTITISGRGRLTEMVYHWLKTIVPTSVESERVFSTVGRVVSKVRSRSNDETVDALVFLKCHYR